MMQMRNLSIDPDFYNQRMQVSGRGMGMYRMLERVKREYPRIQYGYFNRTRENFYPEGFETSWPILTQCNRRALMGNANRYMDCP